MATNTSLITVKVALLALLTAGVPTGVSVNWANPVEKRKNLGTMYFSDTADVNSSIPTMKAGRKKREEIITLELMIEATDRDPQVAETYAVDTLFKILDDTLADDPNLGLTASPTLRAILADWESMMTHDVSRGWRCSVRAQITVEDRIS